MTEEETAIVDDEQAESVSAQDGAQTEAPKDAPGQEITNPEQIRETLDRIYGQFYLIVHQTAGDTAQNIVTSGDYFHGPLNGTALMQSPETIMSVLPELDSDNPTYGTTHKGADGAVVMAFPRSIIDKQIEDGVIPKVQGMNTIDDTLIDLYSSGLLDEIGLPNNLIVGHYSGGKFNLNPNVNFEIPQSWQEVDYTSE
jgi:hypothetical protein